MPPVKTPSSHPSRSGSSSAAPAAAGDAAPQNTASTSSGNSPAAPLMLSVSGARGIVGASITPSMTCLYTAAFASHMRLEHRQSSPLIVLGRDSRPSGRMLVHAAIAGLVAAGCRVIDLGVVATPTLGVMINRYNAHGGVCITASHNPIEWNGIKLLNHQGLALPRDQAEAVVDRYNRADFVRVEADGYGTVEADDSATQQHVERVLECVDVELIRQHSFRVVLDSVNGAGCDGGRALLDALGCDVVHMHGEPTGIFAHTPEPTETNLTELAKRTKAEAAAIGFAQDPDADRLAVIDEQGTYIGEEYTLALCALRMLERSGGGTLVANLSSSRMIDEIAAQFTDSTVQRSAVGEANVVELMQQHDAIMGGEGNGGVILPDVTFVRDSLGAMALVLELLATRRETLPTLSALIETLPRYVMIKHRFDLDAIGGREALPRMFAAVRKAFASDARIADVDGVRIDVEDGWVHLRPSNTEPIVRLIAEAESDSRAWELIDEVAVAAGLR